MGGNAFENTPRMSTPLYTICRANALLRLSKIFTHVSCPRKQPDKTTHGDLDILVAGPTTTTINADPISEALDATYTRICADPKKSLVYYAIRTSVLSGEFVEGPSYVQVDLQPCKSAEELKWMEWRQDYGDIGMMVGSVCQPLGFHMNEEALYLRVEEVEGYGKEAGRILLTKEPKEAMAFLGLDVAKHTAGFASDHELFTWLTNCPAFTSAHFSEGGTEAISAHLVRTCDYKEDRPMFRKFIDEWLPKHPIQSVPASQQLTRQVMLHRALAHFDVRSEYNDKVRGHFQKRRYELLSKRVEAGIPDLTTLPDFSKGMRTRAENCFKRWVRLDGDGLPVVVGRGADPLEAPVLEIEMFWLHGCVLGGEELEAWARGVWVAVWGLEWDHGEARGRWVQEWGRLGKVVGVL